MKILIAADMEGITGVVTWNHVDPTHIEYARFRHLMTADVNAAIRGALAGGADEVVVADGHSNGANILIEDLDPRARLNTGSPSPFAMVQGIDQGVDAVFLVGYHARMGTPNAILDHTWSSRTVRNVWLNGRVTGETGLNASLCGHFGAPVLLVTGDQSVSAEAAEWIPGIERVVVKRASGRFSAEVLPPAVSQALIEEASTRAVRSYLAGQSTSLLQPVSPVSIAVEFLSSEMADKAAMYPAIRRLEECKVEMELPDMAQAYRAFRAAVALALG